MRGRGGREGGKKGEKREIGEKREGWGNKQRGGWRLLRR